MLKIATGCSSLNVIMVICLFDTLILLAYEQERIFISRFIVYSDKIIYKMYRCTPLFASFEPWWSSLDSLQGFCLTYVSLYLISLFVQTKLHKKDKTFLIRFWSAVHLYLCLYMACIVKRRMTTCLV